MGNYIDGFVFPIPMAHIDEYKKVAKRVALIWKEYGASDYVEFIGDDLFLEGTNSFVDIVDANENEYVVFGWVVFPSKEVREEANAMVPKDPRMTDLVAPLIDSSRLVFDAQRMVYGGFRPLDS